MEKQDKSGYDIKAALNWFDDALSREDRNIKDFNTNQRFRAGDQWEDKDKRKRGDGAVVVNKLETPVLLTVNQLAQSLPGPKVSRRDAEDTENVAELYEGIIRDVEYVSSAQDLYLRQADYAFGGNIGIVRLYIDYVSEDSFDKEPRIGDVADPMLCILDPNAQKIDRSDMKRAMIRQLISFEDYRQRFNKDPEDAHSLFIGSHDQRGRWFDMPKEHIWIAEDWRVEYDKKELLEVNGHGVFADDMEGMKQAAQAVIGDDGMPSHVLHVTNRRFVNVPRVMQRIIDGVQVLQETEWPGSRIPIFPIICQEYYAEGERIRKSGISDARTPQRIYNYTCAQELMELRNAPTPKFLIGTTAAAGYEDQYKNATDPDVKVLFYNDYDEQMRQLAPPVYQRFDANIQNYLLAKQHAENDVQQLTRTPSAALGESQYANESGEKIAQLKAQSGLANSHAGRALKVALQGLYKELIKIIPVVYNQAQEISIIGADQQQNVVMVNQHLLPDVHRRVDKKTGKVNLYDLTSGRYDVIADVGPSYQSLQQETADRVLEMAKVVPQVVQAGPDEILKLQNLGPKAQALIDRVTPPEFKQQDDPSQIQQTLAQMTQQHQMLVDQVHKLSQIIETKQVEEQAKTNREWGSLLIQQKTALGVQELKNNAQAQLESIKAEISEIHAAVAAQHEARLAAQQNSHDMGMELHRSAHEAGMAAMDHAHSVAQNQQASDNAITAQTMAASQQQTQPQEQGNATE